MLGIPEAKKMVDEKHPFTYIQVYSYIIVSEGGTGENRSDVAPLNFWIVLIYLAKNL